MMSTLLYGLALALPLLGLALSIVLLMQWDRERRGLRAAVREAEEATKAVQAQRRADAAEGRAARFEASLALRHLQVQVRTVRSETERTRILRASLHLVRAMQAMERAAQTPAERAMEQYATVAAMVLPNEDAQERSMEEWAVLPLHRPAQQTTRHIPARRITQGDAAWLPSLPTA